MRVVLFLYCILITLSLGVNLCGCASGTNYRAGTVNKQNESWDFGKPRKVKQNGEFIVESGPGSSAPSDTGKEQTSLDINGQESDTGESVESGESGESVDSSPESKSPKRKDAPPPPTY